MRWPLMKPSAEFVVYLAGVALAGGFYEQIKNAGGSEPLFFGLFLAYRLGLRLLTAGVRRLIGRRSYG